MRPRTVFKYAGAGLGAILVATGLYLANLQWTGNFHTVIAGDLYRSAQPSGADITRYAKDYGIRTVVNLRGEKPDAAWYRDEVKAAQDAGLNHINFPMTASKELTPAEAENLIAILRDAPKPILLHCRSGADRTGLVSVIYLQQIAGIDEEEAERQLSIRYGHIGIPLLSPTFAMDQSWEQLEVVLGLDS